MANLSEPSSSLSFSSSSHLSNGSITHETSAAAATLEVISLTKLSSSLEHLVSDNSPPFSDADVVVEDVSVGVHRCILAVRSKFFKELFDKKNNNNGCVEKEGKPSYNMNEFLPYGKIGLEAFQVFLSYLYTGKLKASPMEVSTCVDTHCAHDACRPAIDFAVELMYASSIFQIPEMVSLFQRRLLNFVDKALVEDIIPILVVAFHCQCSQLVSQCVERVTRSDLDSISIEKELPYEVAESIRLLRCKPPTEAEDSEAVVVPLGEKQIRRIQKALDSDDVELVKLLLTESDVTLDDATALHYAAAYCDPKVVSEILALCLADVNRQNSRGYTVLHIAAMRKEPSVIMLLLAKGASASELTLDGRSAFNICQRLTRPKDYHAKTEQGKETNKDRICIDVLEREMRRNPMAGDVSVTSHTMADDMHMRLLYLENRVAFARLLFPSEAKLAMDIAHAERTSEFSGLSSKGSNGNLSQVDLNETPVMQKKRLLARMEALMKTVEMGRRYFPHCSEVLDKFMEDIRKLFYMLSGTTMMVSLRPFNGVFPYPSKHSLVHRNRQTALRGTIYMSAQTQAVPSRTQRIMESISVSGEVGGAGGAYSYNALKRLDGIWSSICSTQTVQQAPQQVVSSFPGVSSHSVLAEKQLDKCDVVVCGGTLGIFIATALIAKGLKVCIVERNILKGREQEWNISRKELMELVEAGILDEDDIEEVTAVSFNPNRCGFENKGEIWVEDILNLGVSPVKLIEIVKKRFVSFGGVIFEGCSVSSISIYDDTAILQLAEENILSSRLIIDAMGNFSPVVKQIRGGRKPDGVCLVVGSCARGFKENSTSDVIYSSSSVKKVGNAEVQYFWEAFPAGSGPLDRTTYMFTYVNPQPTSPKLEELLEDYWDLMPKYQGVSMDSLEILRVIYGIFPTYRDSPLPAAFNRVLQFGDASGIQSPVSFGGFGSLTRHLGRLSNGIYEAIDGDFLDSYSLSLLNPYMPNLSASWLFQRAMSAKKQSNVPPDFINELLDINFKSMERLGDPVLRPFLQDVIQFGPLAKTLGLVMLTKPQILPSIFKQVDIPVLIDWSRHFFMLGYYTFLSTYMDPVIRSWLNGLPSKVKYEWKRHLEAWKYGSGLDYRL